MEEYKVTLAAPMKLKGLKGEIESIKNFCGRQTFIQVTQEITELNELESYAKLAVEADYMLIFESLTESRISIEKAQEELLESLRSIKFGGGTGRIIVILKEENENNTAFINELIKLDIQDFFFVNNFGKDDIAAWLFGEKKTLKDNLKYLSTNISRPQKEVIIKEVPKYIEVPTAPAQIVESNRKLDCKAKEGRRTLSYVIGVVGASAGSGATSLCTYYATYLKEHHKKVLLLDRTENKHLSGIEIKEQEIRTQPLYEVNRQEYDYIIIDFGTMVTNFLGGKVVLNKTSLSDEQKLERQFCNEIVLTASNLPWRLHEIDTYINNPIFQTLTENWVFYINGEKNSLVDGIIRGYGKSRTLVKAYEHDEPYAKLHQIIESKVNG